MFNSIAEVILSKEQLEKLIASMPLKQQLCILETIQFIASRG